MKVVTTGRQKASVIEQEHAELKSLLEALQAACSPSLRNRESVQDLAETLANQVAEHFELEERGGYFADAIKRAPQVAVQAAELQAQHEPLLETVQALRALARSGVESEAWWNRVTSELDRFAQGLLRHESGERSLLQRAYGLDIGAGD